LGKGLGEWLLTGQWNPSTEAYEAAKDSLLSGRYLGINPWLYTGKMNPSEEEYDMALDAAADSLTCNICCVKESRYYAMAEGFLSGLSPSVRNEYWADLFYRYDLGFSLSVNTDFALIAGFGFGFEMGWTVHSGWETGVSFDSNLGVGASAGIGFSVSFANHDTSKSDTPQRISPTLFAPIPTGIPMTTLGVFMSRDRWGVSLSPFSKGLFGWFATIAIPLF
jgi:hypothetical protein